MLMLIYNLLCYCMYMLLLLITIFYHVTVKLYTNLYIFDTRVFLWNVYIHVQTNKTTRFIFVYTRCVIVPTDIIQQCKSCPSLYCYFMIFELLLYSSIVIYYKTFNVCQNKNSLQRGMHLFYWQQTSTWFHSIYTCIYHYFF